MRWRYVKRFQLTWSPALACLHADTIKFMFRLPESGMWFYLSVLLYKFTNKFNLLCKFTELEMTFLLSSSCPSGQCNFISATALYRFTQLPCAPPMPLPCPSHTASLQLPRSFHAAPHSSTQFTNGTDCWQAPTTQFPTASRCFHTKQREFVVLREFVASKISASVVLNWPD